MAVISLVNLAAKIAALGVVFALGVFLAPLLQVLAARLFYRLAFGRSLYGFVPAVLLVLFLPAIALADNAGPAVAPAQSLFVGFILQYLPYLLLAAVGFFIAHQTGIVGFLKAKHDAADATAITKAYTGAALALDHLAADLAGKLQHDLQANPNAKAADLLPLIAKEGKATLSEDGAQLITDGLGVAAGALEQRIGTAVAAKLQGVETHAAVVAGAQAAAAVQSMPLNQVVGALTAKS